MSSFRSDFSSNHEYIQHMERLEAVQQQLKKHWQEWSDLPDEVAKLREQMKVIDEGLFEVNPEIIADVTKLEERIGFLKSALHYDFGGVDESGFVTKEIDVRQKHLNALLHFASEHKDDLWQKRVHFMEEVEARHRRVRELEDEVIPSLEKLLPKNPIKKGRPDADVMSEDDFGAWVERHRSKKDEIALQDEMMEEQRIWSEISQEALERDYRRAAGEMMRAKREIAKQRDALEATGILDIMIESKRDAFEAAEFELRRREHDFKKVQEKRDNRNKELQARFIACDKAIEKISTELDEIVPSSVFPDYLITDAKLAKDPAAAEAYLDSLDGLSFLESKKLNELQSELHKWYEERNQLAYENKLIVAEEFEEYTKFEQRLKDASAKVKYAKDELKLAVSKKAAELKIALPLVEKKDDSANTDSASASVEVGFKATAKAEVIPAHETIAKLQAKVDSAEAKLKELEQENKANAKDDREDQAITNALNIHNNIAPADKIKFNKETMKLLKGHKEMKAGTAALNTAMPQMEEERREYKLKFWTGKYGTKRHEKGQHAREMVALRAGFVVKGNAITIKVIQRLRDDQNNVLCLIKYNGQIRENIVSVEADENGTLYVGTVMAIDKNWTDFENNTPGVPPALKQQEHPKPSLEQLAEYYQLIYAHYSKLKLSA